MSKFIRGPNYNYPLKFVLCVHLNFSIFVSSKLMGSKYYVSNINKLRKKNQSHKVNKNHHTIKIITRSILLKIRKKNYHK